MADLKKRLNKKLIEFISLNALLIATILGITIRENDLKINRIDHWQLQKISQIENGTILNYNFTNEQIKPIQDNIFDESSLILKEYSEAESECLFIGCGGFF
jgi:hypothetical protein